MIECLLGKHEGCVHIRSYGRIGSRQNNRITLLYVFKDADGLLDRQHPVPNINRLSDSRQGVLLLFLKAHLLR